MSMGVHLGTQRRFLGALLSAGAERVQRCPLVRVSLWVSGRRRSVQTAVTLNAVASETDVRRSMWPRADRRPTVRGEGPK